jgi:carboxyl-terminal processing protease
MERTATAARRTAIDLKQVHVLQTVNKLALVFALLLGGCAALDPHNILSRDVRDSNPDFRVNVLGEWGRIAAFDFVWDTIDQRYVDPGFNGVDWRAIGARYRPLAMTARHDDDFWEVLNRMAGELRDSHTRVEAPKYVALRRRQESVSLGLDIGRVEGKIVVVSVTPDSDAHWAGVRPGMEVARIAGAPAEERYSPVLAAEREQSTQRAKERRALRTLLLGEPDTKLAFEFIRSDGSTFTATLARKVIKAAPGATARQLPSGFGYIRFTGFSRSLRTQVLGAIQSQRSLPGLIIDLRNNGGGSIAMAEDIAERLVREKTEVGTIITRTGQPVTLFGYPVAKIKRTLDGSPDAYDKPVVVLVNAGSASASELLAGGLQDIDRVKVVGQRSCGCLQGYLGYATVPGGAELAYSEIGMVSAKGRRIEREGVIPDVEVPITREDLRLYRDRTLEAAEDLLRKIAENPAPKG